MIDIGFTAFTVLAIMGFSAKQISSIDFLYLILTLHQSPLASTRHYDARYPIPDQCRVRQGNADINLSLVRRHALALLKNERTAKVGVKNKRLSAALDEDYLTKVLLGA